MLLDVLIELTHAVGNDKTIYNHHFNSKTRKRKKSNMVLWTLLQKCIKLHVLLWLPHGGDRKRGSGSQETEDTEDRLSSLPSGMENFELIEAKLRTVPAWLLLPKALVVDSFRALCLL